MHYLLNDDNNNDDGSSCADDVDGSGGDINSGDDDSGGGDNDDILTKIENKFSVFYILFKTHWMLRGQGRGIENHHTYWFLTNHSVRNIPIIL